MNDDRIMDGFSEEFVSPDHYIIDITYRIWEERGIDLINDWYASDCPVRTPHGTTSTIDAVIDGTRDTLKEFPDRELLPEDIIVGAESSGFFSSHRVRSTATHLGNGRFGSATGREIGMLTIADCRCKVNRIVEEWLVRDQSSMAIQLGLDPQELGRSWGAGNPDAYTVGSRALRERWADPSGLIITGNERIASLTLDALSDVWHSRRWEELHLRRDRALRFEGPSGALTYGIPRMERIVRSIAEAIPDGEFFPHQVIVDEREGRAPRVSVRWSFHGTHSGIGRYGAPTGVPLSILAITHVELRDDRVVNEWMVMDELASYAQMAAYGARG